MAEVAKLPGIMSPVPNGGITATGAGVSYEEHEKIKKEKSELAKEVQNLTRELEAAQTYRTAAEEREGKLIAELERRKKVLTILTESKKLDAKKLAAVEKFVAEFYAD